METQTSKLAKKFTSAKAIVFHIVLWLAFLTAHCILGWWLKFYENVPLFDTILHALSGVLLSLMGVTVVYALSVNSKHVKLSPFYVALFAFCFALALCVLWEVFEFALDFFFKTNTQRWQDGLQNLTVGDKNHMITTDHRGSGLTDTMTDMVVCVIGAAVTCIIMYILIKLKVTKNKHLISN